MKTKKVSIEVSARHLHLSREDLGELFGEGYELKVKKELSQPGMFAAQETVAVICKDCSGEEKRKRRFEEVRIVGPVRDYTQFEISLSDARKFREKPPIRVSGNLEGTPGFRIIGPKGSVKKENGLVVAKRHVHVSPREAGKLDLKNGEEVKVRAGVGGLRELVFKKVAVRVAEDFKLTCHIDTDEGNAAGIRGIGEGFLINN